MRSKRNCKRIPINLLRQRRREQRSLWEGNKYKHRKQLKIKVDNELSGHEELIRYTELKLEKMLLSDNVLSDIPFDCTPEELQGEIAIANGGGTIIYVERDGLSTLTIMLPQKNPTIANLKRAIKSAARVQHKRELLERYKSRCRRRRLPEETGNTSNSNVDSDHIDNNRVAAYQQQLQQVETSAMWWAANRSTGEFVYSTTRCGRPHRSTVSWQFLWRAFMLIDPQTETPLFDDDGRKLLSEFGIENGATLRFCKREIYYKRRRQ